MSKREHDTLLKELPSLLFEMRQRIRAQVPDGDHSDPNAWLRMEALHMIDENKTPTMKELADYLHVTAPSATSLVSYLVKSDLVERIKEKNDKRIVRLRLTAAGKRSVARYGNMSLTLMQSTFGRLGEHELLDLVRVLRRINNRDTV